MRALRKQMGENRLYNMLLAVLTAITIVVGMRIMGTMLISRTHYLSSAKFYASVSKIFEV